MKTITRILEIKKIENYNIDCLFSTGEIRRIDFEKLYQKWNVQKNDLEYSLTQSIPDFHNVTLENGTLIWKNILIPSQDENGNSITF